MKTNGIERKLDAVMRVFAKAGQIMSGNHKMRVVRTVKEPVYGHLPEAAAWTDGDRITFNSDYFLKGDLSRDVLRNALGIFDHELAHNLYTDFDNYVAMNRAFGNQTKVSIHNIVEDQRIERLFTARYQVAGSLFTNMITDVIIKLRREHGYGDVDEGLWLMICARDYLPHSLRKNAKAMFEFPDEADEVESLIREFGRFTDVSLEHERAMEIVNRLYEIISQGANVSDTTRLVNVIRGITDHTQTGDGGSMAGEGKVTNAEDDADQAQANEDADAEDADDDEADEAEESNAGGDDADSSDGEGAGSSDEDEDGEGGGSGSSLSKSDVESEDITLDLFEAQEDSRDDVEVDSAIDDLVDSMRNIMASGRGVVAARMATRDGDVRVEAKNVSNKVVRHLGDLQVQAEALWVPDRIGRPNIPRIMRAEQKGTYLREPMDTWFEAGMKTKVNMAIALDVSGSMNAIMDDVAEVAWILKRSVEKVGGKAIVYGYSEDSYLIYDVDEKARKGTLHRMRSQGGTDPKETLEKSAHWLVSRDQESLRMMVTVTDGDWNGLAPAEPVIRSMNAAGITTALFGLKGAVSAYGKRECMVAKDINDVVDVIGIVKNMVAETVQEAIYLG